MQSGRGVSQGEAGRSGKEPMRSWQLMEKMYLSKPVYKDGYIILTQYDHMSQSLIFIKPTTLPRTQVFRIIGFYTLERLTLQWCHSQWELVLRFHMQIVLAGHRTATFGDCPLTILWRPVLCVLKTTSYFSKCLQWTCFLLDKCVLSKIVLSPFKCHNRAHGLQVSSYIKNLLTTVSTAQAQLAVLDAVGIGCMNSRNSLQFPWRFLLHWLTSLFIFQK